MKWKMAICTSAVLDEENSIAIAISANVIISIRRKRKRKKHFQNELHKTE